MSITHKAGGTTVKCFANRVTQERQLVKRETAALVVLVCRDVVCDRHKIGRAHV